MGLSASYSDNAQSGVTGSGNNATINYGDPTHPAFPFQSGLWSGAQAPGLGWALPAAGAAVVGLLFLLFLRG